MNVTVEEVAACRKKLNIEVPVDEVDREWKGVLTEFQKYAQVPGFRPGRAPIQVLESKFQKAIADEVQRKLIPQFFREAIAKEKLRAVSMPEFAEVHFARKEPLKFKATFDVAPTFELPPDRGLKVKKAAVNITDEDVENSLKVIADQQASFEDVTDRGIEWGDYTVISYTGTCDGKPIIEIAPSARPLSENKQFWLLVAKDGFLPGFCDPLLGGKPGTKLQIPVSFPAEFHIKELSGKAASFAVEILGLKKKILPPMDDAFAKGYQVETMAELRQRIQDNLKNQRTSQAEGNTRNQLVEQLLKTTPFDLPESVVHAETQSTINDIVRENLHRGLSDESIRTKSGEIFDFAKQSARDKVRASFLLLRVAEVENIKITDADIEQRIQQMAQSMGRPAVELSRKLQETGETESIREQMLIGRALDLLMTHAIVETE